ncbi:MAG: luciferase family protein [Actinomycetota bacterium]
MQKTKTASQVIIEEVSSWQGVETGPGRFGAVQFRLGKRELGHLHGDHLADIPFPRALRDRLVAAGTVVPHRPLPDSGWASRHIYSEEDVQAVIDLLRQQYDRVISQRSSR